MQCKVYITVAGRTGHGKGVSDIGSYVPAPRDRSTWAGRLLCCRDPHTGVNTYTHTFWHSCQALVLFTLHSHDQQMLS